MSERECFEIVTQLQAHLLKNLDYNFFEYQFCKHSHAVRYYSDTTLFRDFLIWHCKPDCYCSCPNSETPAAGSWYYIVEHVNQLFKNRRTLDRLQIPTTIYIL